MDEQEGVALMASVAHFRTHSGRSSSWAATAATSKKTMEKLKSMTSAKIVDVFVKRMCRGQRKTHESALVDAGASHGSDVCNKHIWPDYCSAPGCCSFFVLFKVPLEAANLPFTETGPRLVC